MRPISTALCSFGMSGWVFHAPFIHANPNFTLYGVWERSKKLVQQKYPETISFSSYEELLADSNIELVVVNTPNDTHFDYAKKALFAGKHIIVEKPFTITSAQAAELIALAEQKDKMISVYQSRRYDSDFRTIKKIIEERSLGNIIEAEFHYDRFKPALSPKLHKEIAGPGSGLLYDLGSHLIDQALQLFGMPDAVFADISIVRMLSKVEDYFEVLLYYPSVKVRLKASNLVREALPAYVLHGTQGSFIKSRADIQEASLQAAIIPGSEAWGVEPGSEKGLLHTEKNGIELREYITSEKGNYMDYYDGIYNAIRNNEQPPVLAADSLKVIAIIEAAYKSHNEKKVIDI